MPKIPRMYFKGFNKALKAVHEMNRKQLLDHIDALYGRDRLEGEYNMIDLRLEAIRQTRLDFLNHAHPNYAIMKKMFEK